MASGAGLEIFGTYPFDLTARRSGGRDKPVFAIPLVLVIGPELLADGRAFAATLEAIVGSGIVGAPVAGLIADTALGVGIVLVGRAEKGVAHCVLKWQAGRETKSKVAGSKPGDKAGKSKLPRHSWHQQSPPALRPSSPPAHSPRSNITPCEGRGDRLLFAFRRRAFPWYPGRASISWQSPYAGLPAE